MTRRRIIIIVAALLLIGVAILTVINISKPSVKTLTTDENLLSVIEKQTNQPLYRADNLRLIKKAQYLDQWYMAQVEIKSEPAESDGKQITFVYELVDSHIKVIAYSGDGFSSNAFPPEAPDGLIEWANKPL